jgi:hypothetical protein
MLPSIVGARHRLIGALLILTGMVVLTAPRIWLPRLSRGLPRSMVAGAALKPPTPRAGSNVAANWRNLALMARGLVSRKKQLERRPVARAEGARAPMAPGEGRIMDWCQMLALVPMAAGSS